MLNYDVTDRVTGAVKFTALIDCDGNAQDSAKRGLAAVWAHASDADLRDADLRDADLRDADLRDASLRGADLSGADLSGADLRDASLRDASLRGASLRGADLRGADLSGADLSGASLRDASLRGANLRGAYLYATDLHDTCLVDGGQRSDGHRFVGWIKGSVLMIRAGCRNFTIVEAREHWHTTRGGTPLGTETMARLDMIEATAKARGLL